MGGTPKNTPESFWARVDRSGDCWVWTGAVDHKGYGRLRYAGAFEKAHRLAYKLAGGTLEPDDMVLHSCDTPPCCRPDHLRRGDHAENMHDRTVRNRHQSNRITHCPAGHEYTAENTRVRAQGYRRCRACERERARRVYWERRASA